MLKEGKVQLETEEMRLSNLPSFQGRRLKGGSQQNRTRAFKFAYLFEYASQKIICSL